MSRKQWKWVKLQIKSEQINLLRHKCGGTQSLESIRHGLVFGHVNESSSQTEMREDEKHPLQDPVNFIQVLQRQYDAESVEEG